MRARSRGLARRSAWLWTRACRGAPTDVDDERKRKLISTEKGNYVSSERNKQNCRFLFFFR
jgi:hypothetical protein